MPIGLLKGLAGRALGRVGTKVDDVLNPVLRNAQIKAGNILQQQLNPFSRQAQVRMNRNLGPKRRAAIERSLFEDIPQRQVIADSIAEIKANPALRNLLVAPTAAAATGIATNIASPIEKKLNQVGPAIDNFIGGLNFPGQRTLEKFGREQESKGLGAALELATPFGFLASPFIPNTNTKEPGRRSASKPRPLSALEMRSRYGGSGDMDAGPGLVSEMNDPSQADYIAPPPAPILPPPSSLPPEERAYLSEVARTQQMMAANPYMPQMNLYAQGQRAMQTPEDMAATRDLGLAINRAMYGDMTTPKTANLLMEGLNPPGAAQPVIPMDEEGRIGKLDTAAAGVQDFMRKYAEGMKKRKGEE